MAVVSKWKIEDTQAVEEEGVVRSLTKTYLVTGLANTYADERTLWEAINASGVPVQGDTAAGNTNLVMRRRTFHPVPGTPTAMEVVCEYQTVADWRNSFIFSGGTSLNQIQTNKDIFGNYVTLSYTYPNDYPDVNLRGEVLEATANESLYLPQTVMTATGGLYVDYPTAITESWVWHVNSAFWAGWAPGYWLCTSCDFAPENVAIGQTHQWQFTWTFELNPRSWYPTAEIIDPNRGIVPPDVVPGVGTKSFTWYPSRDFNELFGNT